ncbi:MAG: HEAT repeat domain-containing protein [Nitrosopumilaceae archaeon]|nr:HEAT repeat domain-containing protein [Nitrosopumilaceae archaeon]
MKNIVKVLETGSSEEKIKILETLDKTDDPEILQKIISKLDDDDIKVRGEAFSSLVLNKNKISNFLTQNLNSTSKNIRGFAALALANRNEIDAVSKIVKLAKDERSMVRSCAIGALGHLKAKEAKDVFLDSVLDTNVEVRKSAIQAIIDLKFSISEERIKEISNDADPELLKMLSKLKKK